MSKAGTRQFWTGVHRYLGLSAMFFLLLAALTGCFLCFDHWIDATLNPDLFRSPGTGAALSTVDAVARFETTHPALNVISFPLRVPVGGTIEAKVASKSRLAPANYDEAFIAPQDGHLVGTRLVGPGWDRRHIVEGVYTFHYTLLAGDVGRWLMGVVALAWLIGNSVGFYLTLPAKRPLWPKWRRSWEIDWRARLRWLLLDLHRASGLWLFIGVTALALTSVCMNFFDEAFLPIADTLSPPRPSLLDAPALPNPGRDFIGVAGAVVRAERIAQRRGLGWIAASESYLPERNVFVVSFTPSGRVAYRWLGPVKLFVDGSSGRLLEVDDPYHDSYGRIVNRALYPLHTGEVVGPIGIAIVFLFGVATAEMCVTGFYVWWKKRQARRAMERAKRATVRK